MRTLWFNTLIATAILSLAARTDAAMGPGRSGSPNRTFTGNRGGPPAGFSSPNRTFTGNRGGPPAGFSSPNRTFAGNRGMVYGGGRQNWIGNRTFGFDHGRFGNRGFYPRHRSSSSFLFSFGFPLGYSYYPSYWYYPSYRSYPVYPYPVYDYPSPVYYGDAYSSAPYVYDSSAEYSASVPQQAVQVQSWLELGHDWAKDLRLDVVTWDQLVVYLKAYIVNAPPVRRDEFRRGFIAGYGLHAEEAYDKAMKQAVESLAAEQSAAPLATTPAQPAPSTPPTGN